MTTQPQTADHAEVNLNDEAFEVKFAIRQAMLRYGMSSVPVLSWRNLNRYPGYFAAIYPEAVAPRPDKVAEHGIALHKLLNEAVSDGPYAHFERIEIVRLACSLSGLDLTKE